MRLAVGLISGTSMDGIDAALIGCGPEVDAHPQLLAFQTTPYPPPLRQALLRDGMTQPELVHHLAAAYHAGHCDGLFLPARMSILGRGVRILFGKTKRGLEECRLDSGRN